jgi:steroid delta-isomerase-like uncharacterized protein
MAEIHAAGSTESDRIEANRRLGRKFFEEQDRLRGGPAVELCASDYRALLGGNAPLDREGHAAFAQAFYGAFPDMRHEIEEVIAEPSRIAVRFVLYGTQSGPFFGIPATERAVRVAANVLMEVQDGRVTRLLGIFDEAGLLRQLGVLPAG